MYSDADAAALYDVLNPWGPSDDFYLSHVMKASSVLDVGCGTGMLLHRAREAGHPGRLCGPIPMWLRLIVRASAATASGPRPGPKTRSGAASSNWRSGEPLRVDRAQLRFLGMENLRAFLGEASFEVEHIYGDRSKGPFTDDSRNIIVVARAVG